MATSLMMTSAHYTMPPAKPTVNGTFSHIAEVGLDLFDPFCSSAGISCKGLVIDYGQAGPQHWNIGGQNVFVPPLLLFF